MALAACGGGGGGTTDPDGGSPGQDAGNGSSDGGTGGGTDGGTATNKMKVSGKAHNASARLRGAGAAVEVSTITHVMAVNPESANADRALTQVSADGSFSLSLELGKPYVLVFVDSTKTGAAMAVGTLRANTLDTLSAQVAGTLSLGDVMVDASTRAAAAGITYAELLAGLGLSTSEAAYLGAQDDLSLRYANPDIDGDGVIDITQDHQYGLDFHVRANLQRNHIDLRVNDITDQTMVTTGSDAPVVDYNLTSAYVLYPATFDSTTYVSTGFPATLTNGAMFTVTIANATIPLPPTSYSALGFGEISGWGADYNFASNASLELPGSGGSPATLAFTLGATGHTLTFANVVTKTRAQLAQTGSLAIFLKLNTTAGAYSSIDYRWMKSTAEGAWELATAEEIALTIGSTGGFVSFKHTTTAANDQFGVTIPAQPTGSIAWTFEATTPNQLCSVAVSFDDKLGLRHFVGGVAGNVGVTCSF